MDLKHVKGGFYFSSFDENVWRTSQLFRTEQEANTARDEKKLTWEVALVECKECGRVCSVMKGLLSEFSAHCAKCNKEFTVEQKDMVWVPFKRSQKTLYICGQGIIEEVA